MQPDSALVKLEWEKLAIPFKVSVNVHEVVEASLKRQTRGLSQYNWMSWNDAANYWLSEKASLGDALVFANKSIENEDRFDNTRHFLRAKIIHSISEENTTFAWR